MEGKQSRREAAKAYKEREIYGGLYRIVNTVTGWTSPLTVTQNLDGKMNSFQFGVRTNSCFDPSLQGQWAAYGPAAFELVVLERLKKKPGQDSRAFREELQALLALWREEGAPA